MKRINQPKSSKGGDVLKEDEISWQSATLRIILTLALIFGLSPTLKTTKAFADDASKGSQTEQSDQGKSETTTKKAKIGDTEYDTLKAAFDAAQDGETITMLNDTEEEYGLQVTGQKTVVFDMNGKTIKDTYKDFDSSKISTHPGNRIVAVENGAKLTIKGNGTITGPTDSELKECFDEKSLIVIQGEGSQLTIENGTITSGFKDFTSASVSDSTTGVTKKCGFYATFTRQGGSLILGTEDGNGPSITSGRAPIGENNTQPNANITVYGGTYKCLFKSDKTSKVTGDSSDQTTWEATAFLATASGNINIYGGTFEATHAFTSRYKTVSQNVNITGGTFKGVKDEKKSDESAAKASASTTDITKECAILVGDNSGKTEEKNTGNSIQVSGGTFSSTLDPKLLKDGAKQNDKGEIVYVAEIVNGEKYTTLKAAVEAAKTGMTVRLLEDISNVYGVTVEAKNITLDMNGKTITSDFTSTYEKSSTDANNHVITVTNSGLLTIEGNGTIQGPTTATKELDSMSLICVDGSEAALDIRNGKIKSGTGTGTKNDGASECYGLYGVYVINGATFLIGGSDKGDAEIETGRACIAGSNANQAANVVVMGGTYKCLFKSDRETGQAGDTNDQTTWEATPFLATSGGIIAITGGTFEGEHAFVSRYENVAQTVDISGGTFNGTKHSVIARTEKGSGTPEGTRDFGISGGTFNKEFDKTLLENGYELNKVEDNKYTVEAKSESTTGDDGVVDLGEVKFTVTENNEGLKGVVITKDETSEEAKDASLMTLKSSNGDSYTAKLPKDAAGQIVKFDTNEAVNLKVNDNNGSKRVVTGSGTKNIVAQASRNITYKTQGGTLSSKSTLPKTYTTGVGADLKTTASVNVPTKAGYKFQGWYKNAKGTGAKVTKVDANETENVILYAKWSLSSAKVNTITGNGTVKVNGTEVTSGQSIELTSSTMTISWLPGVDAGGTNVSLIKSIKVNGVDQGAASKIDKTKWQEDNTLYQQIMNESGIKMTTWAGVVGTEQSITVTGIDTSKDVTIDVEFEEYTPVYRLYNTFTSEHLFTTDKVEYDDFVDLCEKGEENWIGEGIDWFAPKQTVSLTHVVRLYNAGLGALGRTSHYYTSDESEIQELTTKYGWKNEESSGKSFASGGDTAIYTCYNELLGSAHHYTSSKSEWEGLANHGWDLEKSKNVGSGKNGVFQAVMSAKPE